MFGRRSRLNLDDAAGCGYSPLAGFDVSAVDVDGAGGTVSLLAVVLHLVRAETSKIPIRVEFECCRCGAHAVNPSTTVLQNVAKIYMFQVFPPHKVSGVAKR